MSAADECGWRNFPPPEGPVRYLTANPEYYPQADILEKIHNYHFAKEMEQLVADVIGTGYATSAPAGKD